ncbi:xylitol oxidase [Microbacterium immunditiarum]|uniref:Xylitol oxidase n=1 Tax=Microbacterium immunditiarum TaxID=337480 RepID=A0A7Y9KKE7_9MICO|nr:xylitol oxidase [Microbacterium immunditiarum]
MSTNRNWAGNHTYRAPIVEARSVGDVQDLVRAGGRVRALGTRHSFNDLPDTTGTLVTVTGIPGNPVMDEDEGTVDMPAGMRYGDLAAWLHPRGWALHNLGSLPHISVAGAIATGTHGSGDGNGNLATAVRRIDYVDAAGQLRRTSDADPDFDGMVVGLGAYGIVVRVTLAVEPAYRVRQDVYPGPTWEMALEHLPSITGAGYSVSIFTTWTGTDVGAVWVKTRLTDDDEPVPDRLLGAPRAVGPADPSSNLTVQGGIPGPWHERLPHFRLDATPSHGDELQSEYFVDQADAPAALRAIRHLSDRIAPVLLVSELRTVAPDRLWLSGAYERSALSIHFTWQHSGRHARHQGGRSRPVRVLRPAALGKASQPRSRHPSRGVPPAAGSADALRSPRSRCGVQQRAPAKPRDPCPLTPITLQRRPAKKARMSPATSSGRSSDAK